MQSKCNTIQHFSLYSTGQFPGLCRVMINCPQVPNGELVETAIGQMLSFIYVINRDKTTIGMQ